ncbi:MAG: M23 family metallopeptidase [candidate division Zixibacteria bacterium]|nr:M23 family metallopeptidase [candidate division Zixibacteria bacterium]
MLHRLRRPVLIVLLLSAPLSLMASDTTWPLRGQVDLSSGFGDYRDGRFHTGVDIRTGGAVGLPVYSPVDGFVWRIKTSYYGYGKGLYVKGKDGLIYVFAHLAAFAPAIDTMVMRAQTAAEKYALDLYPPADSIRVPKGAVIAFTGQTGAGAPHLHFEKRLTDEYPLNPLNHGFPLVDKIPPTLERVGFQLTDDRSLLRNGRRQQFFNVKQGKKPNTYLLDTILYFNSPFGLLLDGFDRLRPDGMKQSIAFLGLSIDGRPVYESRFDTLSFATGRSVSFEYDYSEAVAGEKQVRRLFHVVGDEFAGSRSLDSSHGVIGALKQSIGRHTAVISAQDCFGNKSEVTVPFLWGPPAPLSVLDSTSRPQLDTTRFYFSRTPACDSLGIDSTATQFCYRNEWVFTPSALVRKLSGNTFLVEVQTSSIDISILRLTYHCKNGGWVIGPTFNGLVGQRVPKGLKIDFELVDDGMIVDFKTGDNFGCDLRLDLFGGGKLLKRVAPPEFFATTAYHFFVVPDSGLRQIDSMSTSSAEDTATRAMEAYPCAIRAVGYRPVDTVSFDPLFAAIIERSSLYQPRFVALGKRVVPNRTKYRMNTDAYKLLPEDFPTRGNLAYRLFMNIPNDKSYLTGLCRFDFKKNNWQWRPDSRFSSDTLIATVPSGGTFAAIFDSQEPDLQYLSLQPQQEVSDTRPVIKFELKDTLSGIDEEKGIDIRLDRKWIIPEWDPETGMCTLQPLDPLKEGEHHLAIKVRDRAGNLAEAYRIFTVKKPAPPRK